jgi:hypothetical protein
MGHRAYRVLSLTAHGEGLFSEGEGESSRLILGRLQLGLYTRVLSFASIREGLFSEAEGAKGCV